ncbi:hypothetical protein BGZ60DRAFT_398767 [Tricladium varicosporioides]|nr:hypothetical protein BGZ60DRAFT_398767 [Hymenoscyphus varicosporioides]
MGLILLLSNEILHDICQRLDPQSWVNFSLTCSRFHQVSQAFKKHHHDLWSRFLRFQDDQNTYTWFWYNLAASLLGGSLGKDYVQELQMTDLERRATPQALQTFRDWSIERECIAHVNGDNRRRGAYGSWHGHRSLPDLQDMKPFTRAVGSYSWLNEEQKSLLIEGVKNRREGCLRAILLPSLPNLRWLSIESASSVSQQYLLASLQSAALLHSQNLRCNSFAYLHTVKLSKMDLSPPSEEHVGGSACYTLDFLAAFAALPKLRNLYAAGVKDPRRSAFSLIPASNVTHLMISDANLPASVFGNFLQDGTPLQVFKLGLWSYTSNFNEKEFEKALRANASETLEEFVLLREMVTNSSTGINLQGFTKLKAVTISFANLHSKSKRALINILPSSLERLDVRAIHFQESCVAELIMLVQNMDMAFPLLRRVAYYGPIKLEERAILESACKKSGVWLSLAKGCYRSEEWILSDL